MDGPPVRALGTCFVRVPAGISGTRADREDVVRVVRAARGCYGL